MLLDFLHVRFVEVPDGASGRDVGIGNEIQPVVVASFYKQERDHAIFDQIEHDGLEGRPVQLLEVFRRHEAVRALMQREEYCRSGSPVVCSIGHVRHERNDAFAGFQDLLAFAEGVEHHRPGAAHGVSDDVKRRLRESSLVFREPEVGNDAIVDFGRLSRPIPVTSLRPSSAF